MASLLTAGQGGVVSDFDRVLEPMYGVIAPIGGGFRLVCIVGPRDSFFVRKEESRGVVGCACNMKPRRYKHVYSMRE